MRLGELIAALTAMQGVIGAEVETEVRTVAMCERTVLSWERQDMYSYQTRQKRTAQRWIAIEHERLYDMAESIGTLRDASEYQP